MRHFFISRLTTLFARLGFVPARPAPDFARIEAETQQWLLSIAHADDPAQAAEFGADLAELWRNELHRLTGTS